MWPTWWDREPHSFLPTGELCEALALTRCHLASSAFLSEVHELGVLTTAAALCSSKLSIFFESAY